MSGLTTIQSYNGSIGSQVPTLADYQAAGVLRVTEITVSPINSFIARKSSSEKDTVAEIQAIVDAYRLIFNLADGISDGGGEPSIAQYSLLGITGIDTTEKKTLLGDIIDVKIFADVGDYTSVQNLATAVSNTHTAVIGVRPSAANMQLLGLSNVTDSNIVAVQRALSTVSKSAIDTRLELTNFINTVVTQFNAALSVIINYNGTTTTTAPAVTTYEDAGISNVTSSGLNYINSIIGSTASASKNSVSEIQAIVNSCVKILSLADGTDNNGTGLTAIDYTSIGIPTSYVGTQSKVNLLNDIIDVKLPADVNTVGKLLTIAASSDKVISTVAGGQVLTAQDLQNIGITVVNNTTFPVFQQKLLTLGATDVDTIAKISNLLQEVDTSYYDSLQKIKLYDGSNSIPILVDFTNIGVTGVTSQNISPINSALAIIPELQSDEPSKIQGIVNAYAAILTAADGIDNSSAESLTADQYEKIGVNGIDSQQKLTMVNDVVNRLLKADVDTVSKIQDYVDSVDVITSYRADTDQPPSIEDFENIGVTPGLVNESNLSVVLNKLKSLPEEVGSVSELEDYILDSLFENAMNIISKYDGTNAVPSLENFETINVNSVTVDNLPSINSSLESIPENLSNSTSKVQSIVDSFIDILDLADEEFNTVNYPGLTAYETIGVSGLTPKTAKILGSVIDVKPRSSVDSLLEIQNLANDIISLENSIFGSGTSIPQNVINSTGLIGVTEESSQAILQLVKTIFTPNQTTDTIQEIQDLLSSAIAYKTSLDIISSYGDPGWESAPTENDYQNIQVELDEEELLDPVNSSVFALESNQTNTSEKVQTVVDSFSTVLSYINGQTSTPPSKDDYDKIGVTGLPDSASSTFLTEILKIKGGVNSNSLEKIQNIVDPMMRIINYSNNSSSQPPTASDFSDIGIQGTIHPDAIILANSAINDKLPSEVNTLQKVNAIVTAASNVITSILANDISLVNTNDYNTLGLGQINSPNELSLLNSVLSKKSISSSNTVDKLLPIANTVNDVINSIPNKTPVTVNQLQTVGITGTNPSNLAEIQWSILNSSPSGINTVEKIQSIVNSINNKPPVEIIVPEPVESSITENYKTGKYVVPDDQCVGTWEISSIDPDDCATTEKQRQESYVAEVLNISGAPINVFRLLGVHEQGEGSLKTQGVLVSSQSYPGFPVSNLMSSGSWKSLESGLEVASNSYVGIDFGVKKLDNGRLEYAPIKSNFKGIGAISITQSSNLNASAKQVSVQIADGSCEASEVIFTGSGTGELTLFSIGLNAVPCTIRALAISSTQFNVFAVVSGTITALGTATVNVPFNSTFANFGISQVVPFSAGDMFTFFINYKWKREGIFNLVQTGASQTLNLNKTLKVRAIRIVPTLYAGNSNWEISKIDFLDSPVTNINNIQDMFFNENRDRDYAKSPIMIKMQYSPTDSASDLARFGLNILDQYSFTVAFSTMVKALGRPIVVGDIIEVIPELQYDQNLMPVKKFLEVSDTGWASEGFGPQWNPTLFRFSAQQALPSQETRDIFGTLDTEKYIIPDAILSDQLAEQLDITPLTQTEEIIRAASDAVPEVGSDDTVSTAGVPAPKAKRAYNRKTKPEPAPAVKEDKRHQGSLIEDGMPPNGLSFTEGFKLPDPSQSSDGQYFRLNYPPETKIPTRLYRFSAIKNRWIYQETDRRGEYSSHKPSVRSILESDTKQSLKKKL